jgi:hypothetical protein
MSVRTMGADGSVHDQQIEAGAPSVLLPLGLERDSLHPGDRVTVHASPNKRGGGLIALGRDVVTADGRTLPLFIASRSVRAPSQVRAQSLAGTWFAPRDGFFKYVGSRRNWSLTEAGAKAVKEFNVRESTQAQCIPLTAPTLMVYPVVTTVEVNQDTVVFNIDWMQSKRIVYLDGREHPANGPRTLHGHSIGHWEGDTLVVDSVQYADHREGNNVGLPSGARKHLVERFSLSADRRHMSYSGVLEDPDFIAKPVEFSSQWDYRPDLEPTGLPCDLDVARRYLSE